MERMKQIEVWHRNGEHQRIVEYIEGLPEAACLPPLVSALARAYNNLAGQGDAGLYRKAIALLESVEDTLQDDYAWNFRMAYAYYHLEREGLALRYFEKALEARPGDAHAQECIDDCRDRLALPLAIRPFRARAAEGWASFLSGEAALRRMLEEKQDGERLMERCGELLAPAFSDVCFELGCGGAKRELILTPEGDRAKLFQLVYFQRHAPAEVLAHWDVSIGRQPSPGFSLRMLGRDISAADVQVWISEEDGQLSLSFYSESLLPLLRENEGEADWIVSILLDQSIGELTAMEHVAAIEVLAAPEEGAAVSMDCLGEALRERGVAPVDDPNCMLERYSAYEMEASQDADDDLRLDVFAGVTRCMPLLQAYLRNESDLQDAFEEDGVTPGFFYYPLDGFDAAEERGKAALDFRGSIEAAILERAGADAVAFIGGASGIYCGYLDFIAWDLRAVLDAAAAVFEKAAVEWAAFHTFRRDVGGVTLKEAPEAAAAQETR